MLTLFLALALADPPKITISKETTYITSPLRADGMVDYAAAMNAPIDKLDPKDNAAVLLVKAMGPSSAPRGSGDRYFQMLRCETPPKDGEYLLDTIQFRRLKGLEERVQEFHREHSECISKPWAAAEHPLVAEYLSRN